YDRRMVLKYVKRSYDRNLEKWVYRKYKKEARLKYLAVKADVEAKAEIEKHFKKKKWDVTVHWNDPPAPSTESIYNGRKNGLCRISSVQTSRTRFTQIDIQWMVQDLLKSIYNG
ncbi:MAG: hypothetical protein QXW73_09990, partial [Nitrososphaerales archaeon]